jgi:hypothetical protein
VPVGVPQILGTPKIEHSHMSIIQIESLNSEIMFGAHGDIAPTKFAALLSASARSVASTAPSPLMSVAQISRSII